MWSTEHREITDATPEQIWALWSDVEGWKEWDPGTDEVSIEGPFVAGASGTLRPSGGPKLKFTLTDVRPGDGFSDLTKIPLGRVCFHHEIERLADGRTAVTYRAEISGLLSPLYGRVIGSGIAKELPDTVRALARVAPSAKAATGPGPVSAATGDQRSATGPGVASSRT